jgi:signal transduction histidine kinase
MRFPLRWKILLFTVLAPVVLGLGTLWMVNDSVSRHLHSNIQDSLKRSASVFENMLSARSQGLEVAAQVIVRDPRFFSILTLTVSHQDPQFRATVAGVARDFNRITRADLFEVLDREGHLLASVGTRSSSADGRRAFLKQALRGRAVSGVLVEGRGHDLATVTPILVDGRVVGSLILGASIGEGLARELRGMTQSEVTFISGRTATGSTFENLEDRAALLGSLQDSKAYAEVKPDRVFETRGLHQKTYLTLVRQIPGSDPESRQLYVLQRSVSAETSFLRQVQGGLVRLGIVVILVALFIGFMVSERIARPVRQLVRGAEEMERGNYDYPLEVNGRDEIGYLADRFQDMRQRQRAYVTSLQDVGRLKSEFINVASHELRTPISVIKGFVELFTHGSLGDVSSQQKQALEAIERSLKGLVRIAEDATRMAQIEGDRLNLTIGEHEPADLVEQGTNSAVADAPYRDLTVTVDAQRGLGNVYVDGQRLSQAVANLVRNAIRFTPDGGYVDVVARRDGNHLVLEVRDTGVGISEEKKKHLFSRSSTLRDSLNHHSSSTLEFNSAGLGLGLLIVIGIVEAHGGAVGVQSRPGQGSTFEIRVPADCRTLVSEAA